jgi:hypothetical protein
MKGLKLVAAAIAALALLALPGGALAKSRDRNHDRIPDKWEKRHHLSTRVNVARKDPDHDGLSNLAEFRHGTDPRDADTDTDGLDDGAEVELGDDPKNPDTDDDGVEDGNEVAGTVASFDGSTLVIRLAGDNGGTVTGTVTSATEVECDNEEHAATATASEDSSGESEGDSSGDTGGSGDDDHSGDNSGPGTTTSDDDHEGDQPCTIAPGDLVHEAELVLSSSGNTFTKVELVK